MSLSKKRVKEIAAIKDSEIDYSDIAELNQEFWDNAKIVNKNNKKQISLRIDADVLSFYKSKGKGYQTLINNILRSYALAKK